DRIRTRFQRVLIIQALAQFVPRERLFRRILRDRGQRQGGGENPAGDGENGRDLHVGLRLVASRWMERPGGPGRNYNLRLSSTRLALPRLRSTPPGGLSSIRAVVPM